jgi:hypothetical protein
MSLLLDWWQIGWALAGFFLVLLFAVLFGTRNHYSKGVAAGEEKGWHDRQHWETDAVIKGKLERP